jgi:cytochrome c-type biogenesis protein CcmH
MTPSRWALLAVLLLVLVPRPSGADAVDETRIDEGVREVAKTLRCAVCQNESVWESQAELAQQMRALIRERLMQGETPDQVKNYFYTRYGDYILLTPRKTGMNWMLWVGPFILLGLGAALLYRSLTRWVAQSHATAPAELGEIDEQTRQRIDAELRAHRD